MGPVDEATRDPALLPIGQFGRLAGLSVGALRHYDELDVLRPAWTDPATSYRYYRHEQLDDARLIARLRDLEVPLDEVRVILAADDPAERQRRLAAHRTRVQARTDRLQHVLHHLSVATTKEALMSAPPAPPALDPETERGLAVGLFNRTWELIEQVDRSADQDAEMIHTAHASRYHWGNIGEPVRLARGEWQVSRVYSTLGRGEPALWHAHRCLAILEANGGGIEDWDLPAAYEGLARASAVAGDRSARDVYVERAREALSRVADPEDRRIIEADLATLP
jgi:DNA-binding transcriptional MerR regulator